MTSAKYQYLIVGGTTKSATTSLFFYLKDHPGICASSIKETRYWLEKSYPVRAHKQYDGLNQFDHFFEHCNGGIKMEATPDYLYSENAPENFKKELANNVRIIFILRDPIERLISWYRYAKQDGFIPREISFEDYIKSMQGPESLNVEKQHMMALRHGNYIDYIVKWQHYLDDSQIGIYFFEDLKNDPAGFMTQLCWDAGLDGNFFSNYKFNISNNSLNMRSGKIHNFYKVMRYKVRTKTHRYRGLHKLLQILKKKFDPIYMKLNVREEDNTPEIDPATLEYLKDYYQQSNDRLNAKIQGRNLSDIWNSYDRPN